MAAGERREGEYSMGSWARGIWIFYAFVSAIALEPSSHADSSVELVGRAVLPAATFSEGPIAGRLLGDKPIHGQTVPFKSQPVQGFSAIVRGDAGSFLVLSDNGFGQLANSADYHLRIYRVRPRLKTGAGAGDGSIDVEGFIELRDPERKIPFAIVHELTGDRILTGADFDVESMQQAVDGTFWIGDEFGPFLLHFDADGRLLDPPIPLPDPQQPGAYLVSADSPLRSENAAVRFMNAVRAHAWKHGGKRSPVYSPNPLMGGDWQAVRRAGFPVVVWTLNTKNEMLRVLKMPVDGIISDRPDLLRQAVLEFASKEPELAKGYVEKDGTFDSRRFDAQGHRGGRHLRPESTLPAMEVALDELMTTLELDCGVTKDQRAILGHDAVLGPNVARRADGSPYDSKNAIKIKDLTLDELQHQFIGDVLLKGQADQKNDHTLSPVSVAFARSGGIIHPYAYPSLDQLFDFVAFYIDYYRAGEGKASPGAALRAENAARIRYNIETKTDPLPEAFAKTAGPEAFVQAIAGKIDERKLQDRADVQSFDFRTLRIIQEKYPDIRTVYLVDPRSAAPAASMLGVPWPKPSGLTLRLAIGPSGGFEALGISPDGKTLFPVLEKPLLGDTKRVVWMFEFDVERKRYTNKRYEYPLQDRTTSVADFVLFAPDRGLTLERDDSQGDLAGYKAIREVRIDQEKQRVTSEPLVDLLNLKDRRKISEPATGDIGLGERFAFPFWTIEGLVLLGPRHVGVVNDNNFPLSVGRHQGADLPDDNEFIVIKLSRDLYEGNAAVQLPPGIE
ncbi:MAG: esterase-like activity of phytase family protein [Planctomycetota bacterium]